MDLVTLVTDDERAEIDRSAEHLPGVPITRVRHLNTPDQLMAALSDEGAVVSVVLDAARLRTAPTRLGRVLTQVQPRLLAVSREGDGVPGILLSLLARMDGTYAGLEARKSIGPTSWWRRQLRELYRIEDQPRGLEIALGSFEGDVRRHVTEQQDRLQLDLDVPRVTNHVLICWADDLRRAPLRFDPELPIRDAYAIVNRLFAEDAHLLDDIKIRGLQARGSTSAHSLPRPHESRPAIAQSARRLIAALTDDEKRVRRIVLPDRDLLLEVKIAVPKRGELAADRPFPDPVWSGNDAEIEIHVRSSAWTQQPAPQTVWLPMREKRHLASSTAVFPLRSGTTGSTLTIEITAYFQNKPLQQVVLNASVRNIAVTEDRLRLVTFATSAPPEPTDDLQPVDIALDARGGNVRRVDDENAAVPTHAVPELLTDISILASDVLGNRNAPMNFTEARELLVRLARKGHDLRIFLDELDLDQAQTIGMTVAPQTPVLPLELVYGAEAPDWGADLCRHVSEGPPDGPCQPTARVVCPYAFWGVNKAISRTVVFRSKGYEPRLTAFRAEPLLFAASVRADEGCAKPTPSTSLARAAASLFPAVARAGSWTEWRHKIANVEPEVLLVLGHTEMVQQEVNLFIGKRSKLARPKIRTDVLHAHQAPRPLVILMACSTAEIAGPLGTLPGAFVANGAGAVVGTLSRINGTQGAIAAEQLLRSLRSQTASSIGTVLAHARRELVKQEQILGLLLVAHGELDTQVS